MKLAAELEASLREFASAGAAEVCENGGRLAPLYKLSWEVRGSDDKPLLHIWSEQYNLTRRVIAMQDLGIYRHPLASDTRDPLYRAQAERWLESLHDKAHFKCDSALHSFLYYVLA